MRSANPPTQDLGSPVTQREYLAMNTQIPSDVQRGLTADSMAINYTKLSVALETESHN